MLDSEREKFGWYFLHFQLSALCLIMTILTIEQLYERHTRWQTTRCVKEESVYRESSAVDLNQNQTDSTNHIFSSPLSRWLEQDLNVNFLLK